jgi:hypothetical protein
MLVPVISVAFVPEDAFVCAKTLLEVEIGRNPIVVVIKIAKTAKQIENLVVIII